jgi:hypothetical protein
MMFCLTISQCSGKLLDPLACFETFPTNENTFLSYFDEVLPFDVNENRENVSFIEAKIALKFCLLNESLL